MQNLSITIVQSELQWRNPPENQQIFDKIFDQISAETDLVILPEMFTSGFTMQPEGLSETMNGPTIRWMRNWSKKLNSAIAGSFIVEENNRYLNRLVFMKPDGQLQFYDKKHLFRLAGEDEKYQPGEKRVIIHYKGWKILPLICYDLRFPVWGCNRIVEGQIEYDLMVLVANWPQVRNYAWKTLLTARAIENQAFVAGVNRVGIDENGIIYSGDSLVADPWGAHILLAPPNQTSVQSVVLSMQELQKIRTNFAFNRDWDKFSIHQS